MGWLGTDYLRLEIAMEFGVRNPRGRASIQFVQRGDHPILDPTEATIALVGMNYARALVNSAETREPLFHRVAAAAKTLASGSNEELFQEWPLDAGGFRFYIWPWEVVERRDLQSPKTYVATLQGTRSGALRFHLKMAWSQTRVLAPAAALIPIFVLGTRLPSEDAARFGYVLGAINAFYGAPANASRIGSEPSAIAAALRVLGK